MGISRPNHFYPGVHAYQPYQPAQTGSLMMASPVVQTSPGGLAPWQRPPMLVTSMVSPEGYPIYQYTLSNGHRLIVEQRPTDVVSLRTFVNAGSIYEAPVYKSLLYSPRGLPSGIAHLDEHCHFLRSQNFGKNQWAETVDRSGANFNASTDSEMIQHELVFNREDLPKMLSLHAESVLRPVYREDELTQEKKNVINEMGQRMNIPEAKVLSKLYELMFDRPIFQTLGRVEDVQQTTAAQLEQFHQMYYTPTNMVTVVSGRVDPSMVLGHINREFGSVPPRIQPEPPRAMQQAIRPGEVRYATVHDSQLTYSVVNLAFPAPPRSHLKERVAMEMIGTLLGNGPTSMLETEVQNQKRLVNQIGVEYSPMKAAGIFGISLVTSPGQEQQALGATLGVVSRLSQWMVMPQKLEEIKQNLIFKFKSDRSHVETSTMMLGEETLHQSMPYCLQYEQIVNSITPADLIQTAQKYLNPSTYAVVFGIPGQTAATGQAGTGKGKAA